MSNTDDTFNLLRKNYEDTVAKKENYSYGYKPLPIDPLSSTNINKITITPVGTFTPKRDGTNALNDVLYRLPTPQTVDSCIANAAALKTNFVKNDVNPAELGGTFAQQSKMQKINVATLNKNITKQKNTQTYKLKISKVNQKNVPGLNFRVYDQYLQNNVSIFNTENKFSINTIASIAYYDGIVLPTDYSSLRNATKTNCTSEAIFKTVKTNNEIKISNITHIYIAVLVTTLDSNLISVLDIIRSKVSNGQLNIPAQDFRTLFQIPDLPEITINSNTTLIILYSEKNPFDSDITKIKNNIDETGRGVNASPEKHNFMVQWEGFFKPKQSGNWKFWINSDDDSFLWIGNERDGQYAFINNTTPQNATINNGGLHSMQERSSDSLRFVEGKEYYIKMHFAENGGGYNFVLRAKTPDGRMITNFEDLFYSVKISYTEEEKVFTKETINDVISYSQSAAQEKTIDLASIYNKKFTTADPNPVYAAIVGNENTKTNKLFDCYITNPANNEKKNKMNDILNNAGNISVLNTVVLWSSNEQGSVYDSTSFTKLDGNCKLMIDGTIPINLIEASNAERTLMPVPDETHYLYVAEVSSVSTGGTYNPVVYVFNATNKALYKLDLQNNKQFNDNMEKYKRFQKQNLEWIHETARCLATGELENNPTLGVLYKITPNNPVVSVGQMFRLNMQNGKLTLEMSINSEGKYPNDPYDKVRLTSKNIADNTYSLMKIDVRQDINQLNLYQKDKNATFFVPRAYSKNSELYTQFKDIYPYLPPADTSSTAASKQECETACNSDPNCNAYYSFSEGNQTFCKKINTDEVNENPTNLGIFNTIPPEGRNISNSNFYMKNRKIADQYNTQESLSDVNGNEILPAGTVFTEKTYYPNAPDKNAGIGTGFDTLKYEISEKHRLMFQYLNDPTNFKMADLEAVEKTAQKRILEEDAAAKKWQKDVANQTQTEGFSSDSDLSLTRENIKKAQDDYNMILEKDRVLNTNYNELKKHVSNLDSKFISMSNQSSDNLYHYDFNGFDDSQEKSIIGAITRDTNEILLHQNTLYIAGTITTAAFLIGAIILARSS